MQFCVFTEALIAKKYYPFNPCKDRWCLNKERLKRQKLIELAEVLLTKEVIFKDNLEEIFGKRPFDKEEPKETKSK